MAFFVYLDFKPHPIPVLTKQKGDIAEQAVTLKALQLGLGVCINQLVPAAARGVVSVNPPVQPAFPRVRQKVVATLGLTVVGLSQLNG